MLRSDFDKAKRKLEDTVPNFITLSWTKNLIRFSEKEQLIDCMDTLGTIYGSVESSTTAQTKWFAAGENSSKTASRIGIDGQEFVFKVKWADHGRARLAIKVKHMHAFLTKCTTSLPHACDIAKILDTEALTVLGANDRSQALDEEKKTEISVVDDGSGGEKFSITLTSSDMQRYVPPRTMQKLYETRAEADAAKISLESQKAALDLEVATRYATYKDNANKEREEHALAANKEREEHALAANKRVKDAAARFSEIVEKVDAMQKLGMHEEVNALKRKLADM